MYCFENKLLNDRPADGYGEALSVVADKTPVDCSKLFQSINFELNLVYETQVTLVDDLSIFDLQKNGIFKLPVSCQMYRCQNCENTFLTKYCYQRHQCEFNAEKIILKENVQAALNSLKQNSIAVQKVPKDVLVRKKSLEKITSECPKPDNEFDEKLIEKPKNARAITVVVQDGEKIKFMCDKCNRLFANEANLERHQAVHQSGGPSFVCPSCNKIFIDETRLRTHQETHCKSSVLISTLYRSDIVVFQCIVCRQVFSKNKSCVSHLIRCFNDDEHLSHLSNEVSLKKRISDKIGEQSISDVMKAIEEKKEFEIPQFDINSTSAANSSGSVLAAGDSISSANGKDKNLVWFTEELTDTLYQCEFCNCTYIEKEILVEHQKSYHTTLRNFECAICNVALDNYQEAVVSHWQKDCNDELNDFHLPKMLYCQFCDKKFKSHEALYSHKSKKKHFTPKRYQPEDRSANKSLIDAVVDPASLRSLISSSISSIEAEIFKDTTSNNRANQETSSSECTATKDMSRPTRRGRKKKSEGFGGSQNVPTKTETSSLRYQCEKCSFVTEKMIELELHNIVVHISNYKCAKCGQIVPTARALEIHHRMHSNLKPYVCDQCGRSYSQTSHLLQHLRFHKGIKPFACPHENCDARYTIRPDLKDHIRKVHTRERPYKCSICQKSFLTGSVYYQHRLIHSNDRRYTCDICSKRFFRADALNNHKRIHTNEKPFPCNVCGREFRQKGDRNKHLRTQHGVTVTSNPNDCTTNDDFATTDDFDKNRLNHIIGANEKLLQFGNHLSCN